MYGNVTLSPLFFKSTRFVSLSTLTESALMISMIGAREARRTLIYTKTKKLRDHELAKTESSWPSMHFTDHSS